MAPLALRGLLTVTVACVLAVGGTACQGSPPAPGPAATSSPATGATPTVDSGRELPPAETRRVIAISVDGLNSTAIRRLGRDRTPALHRLLAEGSSTLNARTAYERTLTLPNHTGMLTGRRVDVRKGGHGVTFNSDAARTTVHERAGEYVASVFDVAHDRGHTTALFSAKTKFALFTRTWNTQGAADRTGVDNGRRKIDTVVINTDNVELVDAAVAQLQSAPPTFTFLHISSPDVAGHKYGFMGGRYLSAVRRADGLVGRVLDTVAGDAELRAQTVVVLTADHGGKGAHHSAAGSLHNYRVPFMVWGAGIPAGRNLYGLNADYRSPGSRRPGYAGRQPVRNAAVANLATDLLGLPAVPGSQVNRRYDLTVTG